MQIPDFSKLTPAEWLIGFAGLITLLAGLLTGLATIYQRGIVPTAQWLRKLWSDLTYLWRVNAFVLQVYREFGGKEGSQLLWQLSAMNDEIRKLRTEVEALKQSVSQTKAQ